jgi:hypothetical protein
MIAAERNDWLTRWLDCCGAATRAALARDEIAEQMVGQLLPHAFARRAAAAAQQRDDA